MTWTVCLAAPRRPRPRDRRRDHDGGNSSSGIVNLWALPGPDHQLALPTVDRLAADGELEEAMPEPVDDDRPSWA